MRARERKPTERHVEEDAAGLERWAEMVEHAGLPGAQRYRDLAAAVRELGIGGRALAWNPEDGPPPATWVSEHLRVRKFLAGLCAERGEPQHECWACKGRYCDG